MIDFRTKLKTKATTKKIDPLEIYDSLDRRSETGDLRPSQIEILTEWFTNRKDEKNNIVKLHTGEGKTLIGLLILTSKLNSSEGPCLYLCPNKYLVQQVKHEAEKFGIPFCVIGDDNDIPEDFYTGKCILITHVQKVFHGFTKFGLRSRSVAVGTVVLDDSHACIDSIKNALTIKVKSDHDLYKAVLKLFEDDLKSQGEGSFLEILYGEYNTMLPIPYWSWYDKKDEVLRIIQNAQGDNAVKYAWPIIKDQLTECQAFISGHSLEISPTLMPIDQFGSFDRAKQRTLMSATTQDDSFFIKGLGFDVSSVLNPLANEKLKWSGEKMILIPALISDRLDRNRIVSWLMKPRMNKPFPFGVVSLIPGFGGGIPEQYSSLGSKVATTDNIYQCVTGLKNGGYSKPTVFVNRYDGIDLPDNACRILIIDSMPFFDSLLDRYEEDCRPHSDVINIRIAQKIEQGLGRSVRGEKDYSVIVLVGGDLIKFVKSPLTTKYFSNQTKRQIEIGLQIANYAVEDTGNNDELNVLKSLIKQALNRDEGWKEYYSEEMNTITDNNERQNICDTLKREYDAEVQFKLGEYDKACRIAQELADKFADNQYEKGWYLQQLARYKYRSSKTESNAMQKTAFQTNLQLLKPLEGISYKKLEFINLNRVKRIKEWLGQYSGYEELLISIDGIFQDLSFGMPSEKFEKALEEFGRSIGFLSQRPDKEIKKGPDNLWCGVENQYFLIECKNEVEETRTEINKHEASQMNSHSAWFESEYGNETKCKRILIIPTKRLSYHGDFTHEVQIMRKGNLKKLKENARNFFKEFANYAWLEVDDRKIQYLIESHSLDILNLLDTYSEDYYHLKN